MRIIQEEASEIGARPPVLSGDYKELPIGYMALGEHVDATAMQTHAGFVELSIADGIVTAITGDDEKYREWLMMQPPTDPMPKPTESAQLRADVDFLAAMTGVTL